MPEENDYPDEEEEEATTEPQRFTPPSIPIPVAPALQRTGDALWGPPEPPKPSTGMEDLFEVPDPEVDNDVYTDDLFELDDEEVDMDDDLSDLVTVTEEDVMGPAPRPKPVRFRRTSKPYRGDYPTSLGGVR